MPQVTSKSGRSFACFPAAVLVFLVNDAEQVLLLSANPGEWKIVSGAIEDNETILQSARRELSEEAGTSVVADPVGVAHAHSYHYDTTVRNVISIYYVMEYKGGEIVPGDDEKDSVFEWWSLEDIRLRRNEIIIPEKQVWLFERAVSLFRNYRGRSDALEYFVDDNNG